MLFSFKWRLSAKIPIKLMWAGGRSFCEFVFQELSFRNDQVPTLLTVPYRILILISISLFISISIRTCVIHSFKLVDLRGWWVCWAQTVAGLYNVCGGSCKKGLIYNELKTQIDESPTTMHIWNLFLRRELRKTTCCYYLLFLHSWLQSRQLLNPLEKPWPLSLVRLRLWVFAIYW